MRRRHNMMKKFMTKEKEATKIQKKKEIDEKVTEEVEEKN